MRCDDANARFDDLMDGALDDATAAEVRAHLAGCETCAAEFEALESIRTAAAKLERALEPDMDLWPAIEERLDREPAGLGGARVIGWRVRKPSWTPAGYAWRAGVVAAAAVLVVAGVRGFRNDTPGWRVTPLAGAPVVGKSTLHAAGELRRGEWIRTDDSSRVRVDVARIGHVDVGPSSDVRLKETHEREHRIELARGELSATIWAPPRLFFVETPSGVAEDLGCRYDLVVDEAGDGSLEVTLGFVSFESDGREVIVPDGVRCDLRAATGPGTPYASNAPDSLRDALTRFDLDPTSETLRAVLDAATPRDAVTLWHLIARAPTTDRAAVVDRLMAAEPLPADVTREQILALDTHALERWWAGMYPAWTYWN